MHTDVLIIGGGLAGLACVKTLESHGVGWLLLEASQTVGGRIRTDHSMALFLTVDSRSFLQPIRRPDEC